MNRFRGGILIVAGAVALFEAWKISWGRNALLAMLLGLVVIAVGVWRLMNKEPARR